MRRPARKEMEECSLVTRTILDVLDAFGIDWDELPDIIPEHPEDDPATQEYVTALLKSKGWAIGQHG